MSFNDLERGTGGGGSSGARPGYGAKNVGGSSGAITSGPGSIRGSPSRGSLNNNSSSNAGGGGSTLPLYHASGSSISPSTDDEDEEALTAEQLAELKRLSDGIGAQVFKVNSNTAAIEKLVKLAGEDAKKAGKGVAAQQQGGNRDWTKRAHDLVESTRSVIKTTTPQLKQLSTLIVTYESRCPPQYRLTLSKLQRDFEGAVQGFAEAQRQSARRTKEDLEGAKRRAAAASASAASAGPSTSSPLVQIEDEQQQQLEGDDPSSQQQSQTQAQAGPSAADLEFQEALIAERETEIREIESGIHELNEIFRDLGTIVQEQGGMIDNIEYNIGEIAVNTGDADRELVQAHDYQKRAGKRAACLLLVVGFVVAVVLVAILS